MNLEDFKLELDAKLAALSDEQLRAELEQLGCVFDEPWLDLFLDDTALVAVTGSESATFEAADSDELAFAA